MPSFDEIAWLRDNSPAWRLLRADNAPLVLSFLYQAFVEGNVRSIPAGELASRLDDELYALNQKGGTRLPKPARAYLDDWAAPETGWLRKYYLAGTDEPHYDATPAVEKALRWIRSLGEREFVGTESRLKVIFALLRQVVFGTDTDPEHRLAELRRQRQEIDEQIARVQVGDLPVLDEIAVRDRYQQFAGSDQGKSFQAFYGFLLSQSRQEELSDLLNRVHELANIPERDARLRHAHYDWLDAAERTQATVRQLSEQLRRFLDDQVWFENRRVIDILSGIEARALKLRRHGNAASQISTELDAAAPSIRLPMERPLYAPVRKARISSDDVRDADEETDPAATPSPRCCSRRRRSPTTRQPARKRGSGHCAPMCSATTRPNATRSPAPPGPCSSATAPATA